ncbi:hypothetical protein J4D99_10535 [Siccationidurans ginsengisoli]|uniref:hypothetical protein n=1 Tax=Hymenobacter TaxID=89966 RepID=UPI001AAD3CC3|nr:MULTISPECIES: hypothetical protein [unclassified Hymenobacter]MBO2031823.1 hypothetical protein [Hymenobacter sp. BT559]
MLDFFFIRDEQPRSSDQLSPAGGIAYEEFINSQEASVIDNYLDYYGDFRWSSQLVRQKRALLTPAVEAAIPNLASILKQAFAAECGLIAFGD